MWSQMAIHQSEGTLMQQRLEQAKANTSSEKVYEIQTISTPYQCAEEIYTVLRLFFWDQEVPNFEDPDENYWERVIWKIDRIYQFIISQSANNLQLIFLHFTPTIEPSKIRELSDEIKNLSEQNKKEITMIYLFDFFWGRYSEDISWTKNENSIAGRFLWGVSRRLYISNQQEFLWDKNIAPLTISLLPQGTITWTTQSIEDDTESILSWVSKPKTIELLIRNKIRELGENILKILYFNVLIEYIALLQEREKNASDIKKIEAEAAKIKNNLENTRLTPNQFKTSAARREQILWEKKVHEARIIEIGSELWKFKLKGLPKYHEVSNELRSAIRLEVTKDEESATIDIKALDGNLNLCMFFLSSINWNPKFQKMHRELWEVFCFYRKLSDKEKVISLAERRRFSPEYINSLFGDIYTRLPYLQNTE